MRQLFFALLLVSLVAEAGAATPPVSEKEKSQVIARLFVQLRELYVDSGADEKTIETGIRARVKTGVYRNLMDGEAFARALESDLQTIGRDPHFRVSYSPGGVPPLPTSWEPTPERRAELRPVYATAFNNGFTSTSRLDGNIGYVDINAIPDTEYIKDTAAAVLTFVTHTDALILDLRRARGGEPRGIAYFLSYFLGERVRTFDMVTRTEKKSYSTEAELPGPRYGANKPMFVLTSKDTFSGGEAVAYTLQGFKRARTVGEKTRGGSTAAMPVKVSDHFDVVIPAMATISAATGGNWNNVGVIPDVEVPADQAQDVAYRLALEQVLANEPDPARQERLRSRIKALSRS
jgi:peptidase S41-like protein